jgi:hypothetical protein
MFPGSLKDNTLKTVMSFFLPNHVSLFMIISSHSVVEIMSLRGTWISQFRTDAEDVCFRLQYCTKHIPAVADF